MACKPTKPELDRNWLSRHPICVDWVQWYFTDVETVDNSTGLSTGVEKLYIQWFNWTPTTTAPTGIITDWYCPSVQKDPEIVCMTNDGGETVVKWVVIFSYDWTTWTSTINNLDGSLATGYTVIPCATANQVEEWEVRCDGGVNIVPFYDVETDWAASANVAFWFNPVANAIVVPSGNQTPWACAISKIVQVPNCAWTLDDKSVDSITATYLMNQENKHTEVISDVLTAVFWWTVAFTYTAPTNIAISYAATTIANDTIVSYRTDFGDGYNDVWPSPSHSYNADGEYEIKWYAITLSGNKLLLYAKEVTIAWGSITYSGTNPHVVARTYKVLVAKAFQDYCGATLVGTPYDADGSAYTLAGDFEVATPIIIDELEDNADYQAKDIVCKKEIFATHIKWIATPWVPANSVAYEMSTTVAATYWWTNDATNTYIHLIYPVQSGSQLTPIWPQLTEYFGNPQNWVLFTDVATIQAMTDNALVQMWLSVWDAVYAVNTDNEPIWFLSPTAVAELGNSTFLHPYFWINDAHNWYDQKADVTNIAANSNILLWGWNWGCTPIQEIKEKDSCTGEETYRYIIEDGAGHLIPVTDIYPAFVEADVLHEPCKEPTVLEIREKEVCWFVDGSASSYQLIRLYTRDTTTWSMTIVGYEDILWNPVTWTVVETCCTCSSICWEIVILPIANRRWNSYWPFFSHSANYWLNGRAYNDKTAYDDLATRNWFPTWDPRNNYSRVRVFDAVWTLLSTTVLWPYLVQTGSYTQFLADLTNLTSSLWVTFINTHPNWNTDFGYTLEYNDTTYFGITIEHWMDDHAWWVVRNTNAKRAIKYQSWDAEPKDSIFITWDFLNPYYDIWWREWTNMRWVLPLQNVVTI